MKKSILFSLITVFLIVFAACVASKALTPPDVKPGVYGKLYMPDTSQPSPAIIILHGAGGALSNWYQFAKNFSKHGYVALALDYYAEVGGAPAGSKRRLELWPQWQQTIRNSVKYLQNLPEVKDDRIGIVGFSRGGYLAITTAGSIPSISALVDYYGGSKSPEDLKQYACNLLPTLILHGDADKMVPQSYSQALYGMLKKCGIKVEMKIYPGAKHGFDVRSNKRRYNYKAAADAKNRTLAFFDKYLKSSK